MQKLDRKNPQGIIDFLRAVSPHGQPEFSSEKDIKQLELHVLDTLHDLAEKVGFKTLNSHFNWSEWYAVEGEGRKGSKDFLSLDELRDCGTTACLGGWYQSQNQTIIPYDVIQRSSVLDEAFYPMNVDKLIEEITFEEALKITVKYYEDFYAETYTHYKHSL